MHTTGKLGVYILMNQDVISRWSFRVWSILHHQDRTLEGESDDTEKHQGNVTLSGFRILKYGMRVHHIPPPFTEK